MFALDDGLDWLLALVTLSQRETNNVAQSNLLSSLKLKKIEKK